MTLIVIIIMGTFRVIAAEVGASIVILLLHLLHLNLLLLVGWVESLAALLMLIRSFCRHGAIHPVVRVLRGLLLALLHGHEIGVSDTILLCILCELVHGLVLHRVHVGQDLR